MAYNYIEIIGICFPDSIAELPVGGRYNVYSDLNWISAPISRVDLEAAWDARKKFKIFQYVDQDVEYDYYCCPKGLNYKTELTTRLHPRYTYTHGELNLIEYFGVYDITEPVENDRFKEPVLKVSVNYTRDPLGFAQYRVVTRTWFFEDGTEATGDFQKVTTKFYDQNTTITEGKKRRGNIVNNITMPALQFLVMTEIPKPGTPFDTQEKCIIEGRRFLAEHKLATIDFIDDSNPQIKADIAADTSVWLDNVINLPTAGDTIRDWLIWEYDIQDVE